MIDFNSTTTSKYDIISNLCDKYESNKRVMAGLKANTTTYQQYYDENEAIVVELERLVLNKH